MKKILFKKHLKSISKKVNNKRKHINGINNINYRQAWNNTGIKGKVGRFCYDVAFYSRQVIKSCIILFFGYAPEDIIHNWSINIALSSINSRQLFIQQSSMHYWHIFAAIIFVIACYLVTRLNWHKPVVYLTWRQRRVLKLNQKIQARKNRRNKILKSLEQIKEGTDDNK